LRVHAGNLGSEQVNDSLLGQAQRDFDALIEFMHHDDHASLSAIARKLDVGINFV
jgi:DNA segregation ATPase FtsK/SpoIIIE-like protein